MIDKGPEKDFIGPFTGPFFLDIMINKKSNRCGWKEVFKKKRLPEESYKRCSGNEKEIPEVDINTFYDYITKLNVGEVEDDDI